MKRYYLIVLTVVVFVIATGISTALAGGSSDTSGEGSHCYLFFELPDGKFAQAMVNDSEPDVVLYKVDELIEKYEDDEGGTLVLSIGNIEGSDFCAPVIHVDSIEELKKLVEDIVDGKSDGLRKSIVIELYPQ
jgi:hypothetical protein